MSPESTNTKALEEIWTVVSTVAALAMSAG
jgi:hypothetical protein